MDRTVEVTGWQDQWIRRTFPALHNETLAVSYLITVINLIISFKVLYDVRKTRRHVEQSPSDRAAVLARAEKRMQSATRKQFYMAFVFLFHAAAIWAVDAVIGISSLYEDASENPEVYTRGFLLELLYYGISCLLLFTSVFLLFPALQIIVVSYFMGRFYSRTGADGTLKTYVSSARSLTTHFAYLWMFIGFALVAWWPVLDYSTYRILALEAAFGSGFAWLHAASMLHFRSDEIAEIGLASVCGLKDGILLYGKHAYGTMSVESKQDILPKYEAVPQGPLAVNEKTGL